MDLSKENILLGDIVNYSLKGIIAAMGRGAGVTKEVRPIFFHVDEEDEIGDFTSAIVKATPLEEGDILVVPSKVTSLLEKRYVHGLTVENYTRCVTDLAYARKHLSVPDSDPLSDKDRIGMDKIDPVRELGVRYPKDPNETAYRIAKGIYELAKLHVDIVISDSDSGTRKGLLLINCPTIIATPIGATKGLRLFYCMRVAVAAEGTRNNQSDNPILLVKPYQASRLRKDVGALRYPGFLDGDKEDDVLNILNKQ